MAFPRRLALGIACLWLAACTHLTPYAVPVATMPAPAADAVEHRVILIGDTGAPDAEGEPALDALLVRVNQMPDRTTVVFLGDVVYETGMPEPSGLEGTAVEEILDEALLNLYESRHEAERRVRDQIKAVDVPGARAVIIAGNHDWDQFGVGGWKAVRALETHLGQVRPLARAQIDFLPGGGCPGPVATDVGGRVRLIVLDTQWWLESGDKPTPDDNPTACPYTTEDAVLAALTRELRAAHAAGRVAIVAAHHPLRSKGPHGGYVYPLVHLFPLTMAGTYVPFFVRWFPLPVLGSVGGALRRWASPSAQDMSGRANRHMRRRLVAAMNEADADGAGPLLYAAGHDHSLQVFQGGATGADYVVVSGLGSKTKTSEVRHDRGTLFAHANPAHPGFMQLDVLRDGAVRLAVVEAAADTPAGTEAYSLLLEPEERRPARRR